LTNVTKHAQTNEVTVSLNWHMGTLRIEVRDNGVGFDSIRANFSDDSSKLGLFSIAERMPALGGTFEVDSTPGHGTIVTLTLPVAQSSVDTAEFPE
jgi:signal transduction histidine kinase